MGTQTLSQAFHSFTLLLTAFVIFANIPGSAANIIPRIAEHTTPCNCTTDRGLIFHPVIKVSTCDATPFLTRDQCIAQVDSAQRQLDAGRELLRDIDSRQRRTIVRECPDVQIVDGRPGDCKAILDAGYNISGRYVVYPLGADPFVVYCDMVTDGGGWTLIQRRMDGSVDFNRPWADYKYGFGRTASEHWLGLDKIFLFRGKIYKLRIDLEDFEGQTAYAQYNYFLLSPEINSYSLLVAIYSGTAGDTLSSFNGQRFSTSDTDNDVDSARHCASDFRGGWWYGSCTYPNINGVYHEGGVMSDVGVAWPTWKGNNYSVKRAEMKIKPLF